MPACSYCKGLRIIFKIKNNVTFAEECRSCVRPCKKCDGTGILCVKNEKNQWFSRPCDCSVISHKIDLLNLLELPGKYFDAQFNNFERVNETPKLKKAIEKSRVFVDTIFRLYGGQQTNPQNKPENPRGLLFYGTPGTGKTRLLGVILKELILKTPVSAKFIEFSVLISEIKKGYDNGESEKNLITPLVETDILGIDELGKGKKSEWRLEIIDEIVNGRYNAGKITLFTTNYSPDRAPARKSSGQSDDDITSFSLQEKLNSRIYSRLYEMCDFVDMNFSDYRELTGTHTPRDTESVNVI